MSQKVEGNTKMALKKANDHWSFLEEIEAPMWVDLTLEDNSNHQDMFHQCSSRQLKSAFSRCGEVIMTSDFDLQGSTSPKLPPSVSRSRGKKYRSKKWRVENREFLLKKPHPVKVLSEKSSWVDSGSSEEIKPKSGLINSKGNSRSKSSLVCESGLTGNAILSCSKPVFTCGNPASRSCSIGNKASNSNTSSTITSQSSLQQEQSCSKGNKASKSNTTSTITSQSSQQQEQKHMEVSTQSFSQSGFLSELRISLRKSCVTRQASRVEMNNDKCMSRGRKSSSGGKSSVGSSSNPCYEVKCSTFTSRCPKEITPDSRNATRMTTAAKNKMKTLSISKESTIKIEEGSSNSRRGTRISVVKPTRQEAAKPKVQKKTLQARSLLPIRVNEQQMLSTAAIKSKEKMRAGRFNRLSGAGKENATGRMTASQKCSGNGISAGVMVRGQKGTKQSASQKGGTGLVGSKEKNTDRCEVNVTRRVYLR
ncbi:uncharacterized protein LOC126694883 isoform X2 [Quercus robur]|uniref:uncharacterized protein LOC126694883 isoform X2 n=1 Tax=Quercus robur TaxID=38942 RepID=UPI00216295CF|nr:uncharacterized protein LOC126694883 isoform X2 [Quercus robur]